MSSQEPVVDTRRKKWQHDQIRAFINNFDQFMKLEDGPRNNKRIEE